MSTRSPSPARYSTGFGALLPWSPVLVGVGVVIGYVIWILVVPPGDSPATSTGGLVAPPPASPPPAASVPAATPGVTPSGVAGPTAPPGAIESPGVSPLPLDPTAAPGDLTVPGDLAAPDDFVARYRLLTLAEHAFTGRVVLVNGSDQPRRWRLVLEFPPDVGDLVELAVEGGPEPAVDESGNRLIVTGAAPIEPVSWVRLTLEVERSGDDVDPIDCTVNGAPCG